MASLSFEESGPALVRAPKLFAQVDDFHRRERPIFHARFELQELIFSRARIVKTFQRRRRRTQQRHRAFELRAHDGNVPPVIARRFFLLVARFLLFIDDDQAQIFERREHRRTRSHHDAGLAAPHAPPFARALHFRQRAVKHRNARAEPRAAQPSDPQRQRNFRHQNQRRLVARERRFDGAQIHFRLAAAGDAVEQAHFERARIEPAADFGQFALLIHVENVRRRRVIHFEQDLPRPQAALPNFSIFPGG